MYSKKFQVNDFAPIYVQSFVVFFPIIISRLQVPVMAQLASIEVVYFSVKVARTTEGCCRFQTLQHF